MGKREKKKKKVSFTQGSDENSFVAVSVVDTNTEVSPGVGNPQI